MKTQNSKKPVVSVTAADVDFEFFRGTGNGGQKKQKTSSACRATHPPSGAVGRSEEHREQSRNKHLAFQRMAMSEKFQKWIRLETMKRLGVLAEIEAAVERAMEPGNLKVEVKDEKGLWTHAEV